MEIALYIHIPYCFSKCDYCDFFSIACGQRKVPDEYLYALFNEIRYRLYKNSVSSLSTVYVGGGTPSILSFEQIKKLSDFIYSLFDKAPSEFTIEANPDDISENFLSVLNESVINRLSVGIQAFDEKTLAYVHRRSSSAQVYEALNVISSKWKGILSCDMIAALPGQTKDSFEKDLSELIKFNPDHISMYSLTIEEDTVLGKKIDKGVLKYDFQEADEIWLCGRELLKENGFYQYEVSNFCKKGYECRHNMAYWTQKNYLGCGAAATGSVYEKSGSRFTNTQNITSYIDFWTKAEKPELVKEDLIPGTTEKLDEETKIFEFFMMGLRTLKGISLSDFEEKFGQPVKESYIKIMESWKEKERAVFYEKDGKKYFSMNEKGILFLNDFLREII
ncbi:MAG: radical SAM family heme chaperone HemW [Treponema sp.]|nr:radical SAM family heme chaperone HemW [Treponema sp.]